VLGLRSFDGFAAGRADEGLRSVVPDGLTAFAERFVEPVCLVTVPDEEPDPPLRACAPASDPDATNASDTNIAASAVLIVLIIVQF